MSAVPTSTTNASATVAVPRYPNPKAVLELLKPITWFPPMWAFLCGVVSSGVPFENRWHFVLGGMVLAGPLVCAMSQAINDWYDRHVDAINEPNRPIPSGRVPGQWGLYIAGIWSILSLVVAGFFGVWVVAATFLGLVLAWAYSAPPFRLKLNGWFGNAAVAFSYEGLAWFTGAAVMIGALPDWRIVALAVLYSLGAHGIMTLNDFKAIAGDKQMGVRTVPVQIGAANAAKLASAVMAVPQILVISLLLSWGLEVHAAAVCGLLLTQLWLMNKYLLNTEALLHEPKRMAALYNGTGTTLYVIGMLVSAFGVGSIIDWGV